MASSQDRAYYQDTEGHDCPSTGPQSPPSCSSGRCNRTTEGDRNPPPRASPTAWPRPSPPACSPCLRHPAEGAARLEPSESWARRPRARGPPPGDGAGRVTPLSARPQWPCRAATPVPRHLRRPHRSAVLPSPLSGCESSWRAPEASNRGTGFTSASGSQLVALAMLLGAPWWRRRYCTA